MAASTQRTQAWPCSVDAGMPSPGTSCKPCGVQTWAQPSVQTAACMPPGSTRESVGTSASTSAAASASPHAACARRHARKGAPKRTDGAGGRCVRVTAASLAAP